MHYLKCIAMLDYLLRKLHSEQRQQVPIRSMQDIPVVVSSLKQELAQEKDPTLNNQLNDLARAANEVSTSNVTYLSNAMKGAIVTGINDLKVTLQLMAFNFYKINDFEVTDTTINIMRDVVKCALANNLV